MKKWIGLLLGIVLATAGIILILNAKHKNQEVMLEKSKANYNCAMHPQYISDKPGNCPICGMKLTLMDKNHGMEEGSHEEKRIAYYRDPMHPWITSDKPGKSPDCGMDLVAVYESDSNAKGIRIDPTTVQNMGVKTEQVMQRDLPIEIRANGKVKVEESKIFIVNARVMGYAEKLYVNVTGQKVMKNQALLDLYSPDLVSTQEEYLQAVKYAQGMDDKLGSGSRDLVESAKHRLLNWGIAQSEISALEKRGKANNTLSIASPISGIVLEKMVVDGQSIIPGMLLYKIADLSKLWVVANIYQQDIAHIKIGSTTDIELSSSLGKSISGKVIFISPVLDEQTKTAEIRIEVMNTPSLDIKPEMFATVHIHSSALKNVVAIPEQAIIRSGKRNIAIVSVGSGYFEPRELKLGLSSGEYVQVLAGLHSGENLVISAQFLIDSESNLKAAVQQLKTTPEEDSASMSSQMMEDSSAHGANTMQMDETSKKKLRN